MKNIVVLVSGRGSNLSALLQAAADEQWGATLDARIAAVISNRADAAGLALAAARGLASEVIDHRAFAERSMFDAALAAAVERHSPSLVVLAGFMRVLSAQFVRRFEGRLINIHPSLLPLFPGLGTHRQALEAGVRVHGATVHFVSEGIDCGAIIAQAAVPVWPDDDEERLAARVLAQEHRLLPRAVRALLDGSVRYERGRVAADPARAAGLALLAS